MTQTPEHRWLNRWAVWTTAATLLLICVGGLVTSHEVGMSVPDWPNTYGYNLFFFPVSKWVGGIFYEHTHRLIASAVGLLTAVLALWLWGKKARPTLRWAGAGVLLLAMAPRVKADTALFLGGVGVVAVAASFFWPRSEPSSRPLRWLGILAFVGVVVQGILGGLRVRWNWDGLGIPHATLAQLFLVLLSVIALMTSSRGQKLSQLFIYDGKRLRYLYLLTTVTILFQLILGATMRHQHAGLAIPDFPAAYGKLWPALDAASVAGYNQNRMEAAAYQPITAFQVGLQMAHRIAALAVFFLVAGAAWRSLQGLGRRHALTKLSFGWLGLIAAQIALGATTIWTDKSADIATAHVAVGALSLMVGGLMTVTAFCASVAAPTSVPASAGDDSAIQPIRGGRSRGEATC